MNISLTKPLEEFVQSKVATGMYASASEVVRAGLRALAEQELDRKIKLGIEQADAGLAKDFNDELAEDVLKKVNQRVFLNQEK
jgi:putative addiction module CopG family antidote